MRERDRRAAVSSEVEWALRSSWFHKDGTWENAIGFAADVWAAEMLVEAEWGCGSATPTRIANWLRLRGRDYGYTEVSLRKMVYKARDRIGILENTTSLWNPAVMVWPAFVVPANDRSADRSE